MIRTSLLMASLALVSLPSLAQVNALPDRPHILVYGSATARALPDRFQLTMTVKHTDPQAGIARQRVATLFDEVIAQLDAVGVPASEVEATSLSIDTVERWDDSTRKQRYEGIQVSRDIKARFAGNETLETFLATLKTSENLTVGSVRAELSSEQALRRQLRGEAIADSRSKAESIAASYKVRLGSLYSVSDVAPEFSYGIREGSWPALFQWRDGGAEAQSLQRIEVSGSRLQAGGAESFHAGYITFESKLYAVFHLGPATAD